MARKGLNIYKRKDGRWEARYIKSRNTQGKPRYGYLYATSYHKVRNNLQKVIQALNATDNEKVPATNYKFMGFSAIWLENSSISLKESTYIRYRTLLNCYLMPSFQQLEISEITSERVCTFCKELEKHGKKDGTGLSPKTISDILSVLRRILHYAQDQNISIDVTAFNIRVKQTPKVGYSAKIRKRRRCTMAIRQCTRHHFYDDEKYKVCPICLSLSSQNHENEDRTVAYTTPLDNVADKTIGYQALKDDVVAKPTVGWVVCVKGKNCGRDWRLHEGRNDIGTAVNAEVPIQLTGQEELETRLTQASMPVYAFCVDTADRQSRDGLGTFARTTGGELFVFGPQNAAQVWQKWKERLNQTVCLGFESTANYADGELHTLLLKETAGAQSDTRQIRITNWLVDDTAPEVISFRYDNEKNTIEIEFSEPVLGADKANAYRLKRNEKTQEIKGVVVKEKR